MDLGWALKPRPGVPYERKQREAVRGWRQRLEADSHRPGTPGAAGAGRGRKDSPRAANIWREPGPADTSISDFQPPDGESLDFCRLKPQS